MQTERKSITGDPDVDEVLYALDSKNELAIEQALNRVANSAATQALLKKAMISWKRRPSRRPRSRSPHTRRLGWMSQRKSTPAAGR